VDPLKFAGPLEAQAIYKLIERGFDPTVRKGYGPWFPKKMPVSEGARDLMSKLMEMDTSKRFTAKEALQHPWIRHDGKSNKELKKELKKGKEQGLEDLDSKENEITAEVGYQFANFATSNQFKHAISALFRDKFEKMRPQNFDNLKKLFAKLDTDKSGTLDYEEFKKGMLESKDLNLQEEDIKKMFTALDANKLGQIDFNSMVNAAVHDYLIASDQRLYEAFRDLDDDEDGKIKTDQMKAKIKQMDIYGNADKLLEIIDTVDLDKDGTIDYEEFLRALHPDFNETPKWFWGAQNQFDENKEDQ